MVFISKTLFIEDFFKKISYSSNLRLMNKTVKISTITKRKSS